MPNGNSSSSAEHPAYTSPASIWRRVQYRENSRVSFGTLFGSNLEGAREIVLTDPHIDRHYKARHLSEFIMMVADRKAPGEQISLRLKTRKAEEKYYSLQDKLLKEIAEAWSGDKVEFMWSFFPTGESPHDRCIETDTGQIIDLSRGLDLWKPFNQFGRAACDQEQRLTKSFTIGYFTADECKEVTDEESASW